jgi:ectoine hydroxylase-related dioxygenase (phytanoyl-CoA dioxygenase family)
LISKIGAESQRVHSDTTYQPTCPLYTVFIAIQDVIEELGPTIFIKGTNTSIAHNELRHKRNNFLNNSIYHQALLTVGDCVVMDSRNLHCGGENLQGNRCLMYFTVLNPSFTDMGGKTPTTNPLNHK